MLKSYLYIPEHLQDKIVFTAKTQNKSKAEILREALEEGLNAIAKKQNGGTEILIKLTEIGKKYGVKSPVDASVNHDYYLWGLPKKNPRIKP